MDDEHQTDWAKSLRLELSVCREVGAYPDEAVMEGAADAFDALTAENAALKEIIAGRSFADGGARLFSRALRAKADAEAELDALRAKVERLEAVIKTLRDVRCVPLGATPVR